MIKKSHDLTDDSRLETLKQNMLDRVGELSMLPSVAIEAIQLSGDPNCSAEAFSNVVQRDVALATKVLTLCNSPLFAGRTYMSNLQQAVVRLGFRQCRSLIVSSCAASLMKSLPEDITSIRETISEHCYQTASASTIIGRELQLGLSGEEFSGGLLHDFGRTLLAIACKDRFLAADPLEFGDESDQIAREQAVLGTDHCEFGAWFLADAGLPGDLVDIVRFHHLPADQLGDRLDANVTTAIATVRAADHVSNHIQAGGMLENYNASENSGIAELASIHDETVYAQFDAACTTIFSELKTQSPSMTSAG